MWNESNLLSNFYDIALNNFFKFCFLLHHRQFFYKFLTLFLKSNFKKIINRLLLFFIIFNKVVNTFSVLDFKATILNKIEQKSLLNSNFDCVKYSFFHHISNVFRKGFLNVRTTHNILSIDLNIIEIYFFILQEILYYCEAVFFKILIIC